MLSSQTFAQETERLLAQLEEAARRLQEVVEPLCCGRPGDVELATEQLDLLSRQGGLLRQQLEQAAAHLQESLPAWQTRQELGEIIQRLKQRLAAQEADRQRPLLEQLLRRLTGTVRHRLRQRREQLEEVARQARRELETARAGLHAPPLPELPGAGDWLEAAWALQDPDLTPFLEGLRQNYPALARFLEEVEPGHWEAALPAVEPVPPANGGHAAGAGPAPNGHGTAAAAEPSAPPDGPGQVAESPPRPAPAEAPAGPIREEGSPRPWHAASASAAEPPSPHATVPRLEPELLSFKEFRSVFWLHPTRGCERVPWRAADFPQRLRAALAHEPLQPRLWIWWVYNRALEELGQEPVIHSLDLEAFADIWDHPRSTSRGKAEREQRTARLRHGLEAHAEFSQPCWRIPILLEGLRPSRESPLDHGEATEMVGRAFRDRHLRHVLDALLRLAASGADNPVEALRVGLRAGPGETVEQLEQELARRREQFHQEMRRLWSAAGGRIERTHCRQAWQTFIEAVGARLQTLYPVDRGGSLSWDVTEMGRFIDRLPREHDRIADAHDAYRSDRHKMNRAAAGIAEQAGTINRLMRRLLEVRAQKSRGPVPTLPLEDVRVLEGAATLANPDEELGRQLLLRVLRGADETRGPGCLSLTPRDLCNFPDLLPLLENVEAGHSEGWPGSVCTLRQASRAAAVLLDGPNPEVPAETGIELEWLRGWVKRCRPDLLPCLAGLLSGSDMQQVHRARADSLEQVLVLAGEVQRLWRDLNELGDLLGGPALQGVADEARRRVEEAEAGLREPELELAWLQRVAGAARQARDRAAAALSRRAAEEPNAEKRAAAREALQQGHFAHARWLLGEQHRGVTPPAARQTLWRHQARGQFRNLLQELEALPEPLGETWQRGISARRGSRLRREFAELVFSEGRKGVGGLYGERDPLDEEEFRLKCERIRAYLARQQLNPCYLPQLSRFEHLVLTAAPVSPRERNFVEQTAQLVSRWAGKDFVVVLAPQLTEHTRQELLAELRDRRRVPAAVLDDLDVCRLINPRGGQPNLVLGLLEIAFEQLRWRDFSPFGAPEGQHVKMEMYVGRRREAQELARQPRYSRLFSGRKLGKSALLKYVEQTYDHDKLPSGNTLRVLYVPAAGAESEGDVVDRILNEMRSRLQFAPARGPAVQEPGDQLELAFRRYLEERPQESLLVVLDESDVFVEAQLEEYDRRPRESCLSFRMRSVLEAPKDSQGLPRVRFVFSGYRATHTTEGAWVNWGEVLRLAPLSPDEAAELIARPLARLGIDATQQAAAIAYRCGYQPAVLLNFGEQLLEHLEKSRSPDQREPVEVTTDDVAAVFNMPCLQESIRHIVRQNFQGNRIGAVVFAALLLEFAAIPAGAWLEDAAERVLERVRPFGPLDWLEARDSSALGAVTFQLRDFEERQLLVAHREATSGVSRYRLKFPHHLPVLCQPDQLTATLRAEIEACRQEMRSWQQPGAGRTISGPRALVAPRVLQDLREVVLQPVSPEFPIRAALVGSLWPEAVAHRSGGIPDRLGIEPAAVRGPEDLADPQLAEFPCLVLRGATPEAVRQLLARRPPALRAPLFLGGADLLRWGLEPSEALHEVVGLGRLSPGVVRWWFERVRSLVFAASDAVEQIMRLTGGMPLLVGLLDRLLLGPAEEGGFNVGQDAFQTVIARFEQELPACAARLTGQDPAFALLPRERELLAMAALVCRENGFASLDLREHLIELWDLYRERCAFAPLGETDGLALRLLQDLGLLPVRPERPPGLPLERLQSLEAGDPLLLLLPHLEARQ